MNERRPIIYAIDFDGTIVQNKWPDIGEGIPEVMAFIGKIQQRGDKWILWTMRENERLEQTVSWLAIHGLFPNAINDNTCPNCKKHLRTIHERCLPMSILMTTMQAV